MHIADPPIYKYSEGGMRGGGKKEKGFHYAEKAMVGGGGLEDERMFKEPSVSRSQRFNLPSPERWARVSYIYKKKKGIFV